MRRGDDDEDGDDDEESDSNDCDDSDYDNDSDDSDYDDDSDHEEEGYISGGHACHAAVNANAEPIWDRSAEAGSGLHLDLLEVRDKVHEARDDVSEERDVLARACAVSSRHALAIARSLSRARDIRTADDDKRKNGGRTRERGGRERSTHQDLEEEAADSDAEPPLTRASRVSSVWCASVPCGDTRAWKSFRGRGQQQQKRRPTASGRVWVECWGVRSEDCSGAWCALHSVTMRTPQAKTRNQTLFETCAFLHVGLQFWTSDSGVSDKSGSEEKVNLLLDDSPPSARKDVVRDTIRARRSLLEHLEPPEPRNQN
eukprot:3607022-Rhodomonas_salina.2